MDIWKVHRKYDQLEKPEKLGVVILIITPLIISLVLSSKPIIFILGGLWIGKIGLWRIFYIFKRQ